MKRWLRIALAISSALAGWACKGPDGELPPRYREVAVPHERLVSAEARERGRGLYLAHCALCHGERADGHGPRSLLSSRPADFTSKTWRRTVTPRKAFFILREGVHGTAMPAWPTLTEDETWDLVAYVLSVSEKGP
jgi:mono/diheme cytochrome c family protein